MTSRNGGSSSAARTAGLATLTATTGVVPVFLLGAVAALMRDELGITSGAIGLAAGLFFAGSAVSAAWGGRRVEYLGHWRVMRIGTLASACMLVLVAAAVHDLATLALAFALGGIINGMLEPATNAALAEVPSDRPGLTFGVKLAAIPLAALLAGATVPLIAVRTGWRLAFLAVSVLPVLLLVPLRSTTITPDGGTTRPRVIPRPSGPLVVLALACGLGTAGATSLATYLTDGAAAVGISVSTAGWLLTGCGLAGVAIRIAAGWAIDHTNGSVLVRVAAMLGLGAAGYGLLPLAIRWPSHSVRWSSTASAGDGSAW